MCAPPVERVVVRGWPVATVAELWWFNQIAQIAQIAKDSQTTVVDSSVAQIAKHTKPL